MTATQKLVKRKNQEVTPAQQERPEAVTFQPATDIRETQDAVILKFDMPGVARDDVELTVEKGVLTVTGRVAPEIDAPAVYRETRIGDYRRLFSLGESMDTDHIKADMKAGVLTVTIPKAEQAKPKRIKVTSVA